MDSRDKVNAKGPDGALWKVPVLSDECGQATTSAQFYHQPQVVTGLIPLVKLHYIGMADVMSHPHLNWFHTKSKLKLTTIHYNQHDIARNNIGIKQHFSNGCKYARRFYLCQFQIENDSYTCIIQAELKSNK